MKKLHIQKYLWEHINKNKWQFAVLTLSILIGVVTGATVSVLIKGETADATTKYLSNLVSAYNLQSVNCGDIFRLALSNNIRLVLALWLSCAWVGFIPLTILQMFLKGYKLGFTITIFVKIFGIKGIVFSVLTVAPQLLILLPVLLTYAVFCVNFALKLKQMRYQRTHSGLRNELYIRNLVFLVIVIGVSCLVAVIDAYVLPPILKPICSLLI